jgi:2-polyprenyl-3-methyl-5-hydroxy-6-metoxy-1,4-benzoquinol methylase
MAVDQNAAPSWVSRADHYRMLRECRYEDLIRADFRGLFGFTAATTGCLLDAGCGTGNETVELLRRAPRLRIHGVDLSRTALAIAADRPETGKATFCCSALECLPFRDAAFDYISSHEVVEHVEDPAVVLRELHRVLKPGGVCAIATPNGASLWIEHLRQRWMRLIGRRGAPVGADHTRPPSFWRHEFGGAGFVVERQIFDGAALEFQLFVAPAGLMPLLSRVFEPLRVVPLVNWLLCDRVKFRLRKPGSRDDRPGETDPVGLFDFTDVAEESPATAEGAVEPASSFAPAPAAPAPAVDLRPPLRRRLRRGALLALSLVYAGFLALLAPLGLAVSRFHQPFGR